MEATKDRAATVVPAASCQHHWVVEAPSGVESRGVCKKCGAIRGFRNATQDFVWEEERSADLAYWSLNHGSRLLESEGTAA